MAQNMHCNICYYTNLGCHLIQKIDKGKDLRIWKIPQCFKLTAWYQDKQLSIPEALAQYYEQEKCLQTETKNNKDQE